jgi:hypothetical protein
MSKAMKKRILSIAMVIGIIWTVTAGLCFAGNVSVPTTITIGYEVDGASFFISETVNLQRTTAGNTAVEITPIEIENWSENQTLKLEQMQIVPEDGWTLMDKDDFDAAEEDAQKLYLYIPESTGNHVFTYDADDETAGLYQPTDFTIAGKSSKSITMEGAAGLYENQVGQKLVDEPVAMAILTVSFSQTSST